MEVQLTLLKGKEEKDGLDGEIKASKMSFEGSEMTTWQELFSGYHEIRVMTFSYRLPFISKLMKMFERGEVIIGFDKMVNNDLADLFTVQEYTTNYVTRNKYLQERIIADELEFYVVNDLLSHQKVYLLKSDSGKVRTIIGSGNVSDNAWNGSQVEAFVYCDDYECYKSYYNDFETLKALSTNKIAKEATPIKENKENAEELPIVKTVVSEHVVIIDTNQSEEEKDYVFATNKISKEWKEKIAAVKLKPSSDGKILIDTKKVRALIDGIKKENRFIKKKMEVQPQLSIDYEQKSMSFNETTYDLNPSKEDVAKDIANLIEYMNGFSNFTGDTKRFKTLYWKVLNYMFLSPFVANFRYIGSLYGYDQRFFPMYMLIYGESDAGKTKFIELIQKMMLGKIPRKLSRDSFSAKPMTALKTEVKGCPVLLDELTPTYWKYAKDIVKLDDMLIEERMINHPTFILVSNDINGVTPDLSKRVVCINVDNRLNKTDAALNDRKIFNIRKEMTTSLYREYVRRMFERCDALIEAIQDREKEGEGWFPDLFKASCEELKAIFNELSFDIPEEFGDFTWFDYMGDVAISEKATSIIYDIYKYNRSIIKIDRKKNELEIDFGSHDGIDAAKKIKTLHSELPAVLECKTVGKKVLIKLDKAEELLEIKLQKKRFWQ